MSLSIRLRASQRLTDPESFGTRGRGERDVTVSLTNFYRRAARGFSLIEVVLAIGIVSFCLLALIGLFGLGMNGSRHANDDTFLGSMVTRVAGDLRTQGASFTSGTNYFFDNRGLVVSSVDTTAYYECEVTTQSPTGITATSTNFQTGKMIFTWPVSVARAKRPFTNTIYTTFLTP
jgi:uncharacterized protein (TIGR02598 family)